MTILCVFIGKLSNPYMFLDIIDTISFTLIGKWTIDNTEMKHYYVATIPCFEIHRRQTECVCAEKDSDAREVSKIKATRGRDLLEGNGLTL